MPWLGLAAVAGRQGRSVSLAQIRAHGITDRQVEYACATGRMVRRHRGVYSFPPVDGTPRARVWAAHLCLGPSSFASHLAALAQHGIRAWAEDCIHLGCRTQRRAPAGVVVHRLPSLPPRQVWKVGGLPTAAPARALLDSATILDADPLELAVADALADRKVSLSKLDDIIAASAGHHGRAALAAALSAIRDDPGQGRTHGEMEKHFRPLLKALPGLPRHVRNAHLDLGGGTIVKPDVWFPSVRVWIELDSRRWHEQRRTMDADRRKDQRAVALGIAPFRITWRHLVAEWAEVSADLLATIVVRQGA